MRMQLVTDYLNAVCNMCSAEDPDTEEAFASEADKLWYTMTAEEIGFVKSELASDRWIKRVDEDGLCG